MTAMKAKTKCITMKLTTPTSIDDFVGSLALVISAGTMIKGRLRKISTRSGSICYNHKNDKVKITLNTQ